MINWNQQVCLITGATGGIGSAIARALDERGATLLLTGRSVARLNQMNQTLTRHHHVIEADIASASGREKIAEMAKQRNLTMLINNAGVSQVGEFTANTPAQHEALFNTNVLAPMALTHAILPTLQHAERGRVINVGSIFGSIGFAAHSTYCASKFALRGWTEAMLREHHGTNLSFYYLAPRATQTGINSDDVIAMNEALGNTMDPPELVAMTLIQQVESETPRKYIGAPENFFIRMNALFPRIVDNALSKKLSVIKRFTSHKESLS